MLLETWSCCLQQNPITILKHAFSEFKQKKYSLKRTFPTQFTLSIILLKIRAYV